MGRDMQQKILVENDVSEPLGCPLPELIPGINGVWTQPLVQGSTSLYLLKSERLCVSSIPVDTALIKNSLRR